MKRDQAGRVSEQEFIKHHQWMFEQNDTNQDGFLDIDVDGKKKTIGITRAHMEEDTDRNTHTLGGGQSGVDFNRCGLPLLEIVTEPDIRSADEAYAYLTELKQILQYLEVSDCSMEEGKLRAEANISVRPVGTEPFGTKTEVKNVASFSGTYKAIEFEIARQIQVLNDGGTIVQETRGWDDDRGVTFSQRAKESAHDYRYFPEPDLVPIVVDEAWETTIKQGQPELPTPRRNRLMEQFDLSPYDAGVLTQTKAMADYFEATVADVSEAKKAANWIMGDLQALITQDDADITTIKIAPTQLAAMIKLIEDGTISGKIAKEVLVDMFQTGSDPKAIVEAKGLVQISDTGELEKMIAAVLEKNPAQVEEFRSGKEKVIGFLVGQVMQATKGKANPKLVNEILRKQLST